MEVLEALGLLFNMLRRFRPNQWIIVFDLGDSLFLYDPIPVENSSFANGLRMKLFSFDLHISGNPISRNEPYDLILLGDHNSAFILFDH